MRFLHWLRYTFQTRGWVREQSILWAARYYDSDHHRVAATVAAMLVECVNIDLELVTPATCFVADLQMDDLEPVELLMTVEEEFQITIAEEDSELIATVGGLIEYIFRRSKHA
ncbi:hypothetical protein ACXR0O_20590 [Verrucomicrobiota bacterium sgz303538]